jgi:hypothetical protein
MWRFVLAGLMAAVLAGPAAADARWQGRFLIKAKAGSCPNYDPVGFRALVRFRPGHVGENGPDSSFALFERRYTQSYLLRAGGTPKKFDRFFRKVEAVSTGDRAFRVPNPVYVRFTSVSPAITPTAPFLHIAGQIRGFDEMPNCIVTFNMALTRRLD